MNPLRTSDSFGKEKERPLNASTDRHFASSSQARNDNKASMGQDQIDKNNNLLVNNRGLYSSQRSFRPSPHTVLVGRGMGPKKNEGNQRLRFIVASFLPQYSVATDKRTKTRIVDAVIETVRANGGSFVKYIKKTGQFQTVSGTTAREKVGYTFRDLLGDRYRSSSKWKIEARRQQEYCQITKPAAQKKVATLEASLETANDSSTLATNATKSVSSCLVGSGDDGDDEEVRLVLRALRMMDTTEGGSDIPSKKSATAGDDHGQLQQGKGQGSENATCTPSSPAATNVEKHHHQQQPPPPPDTLLHATWPTRDSAASVQSYKGSSAPESKYSILWGGMATGPHTTATATTLGNNNNENDILEPLDFREVINIGHQSGMMFSLEPLRQFHSSDESTSTDSSS